MTTWITICDTCKRENWDGGPEGETDGERLAEAIEALIRADGPVRARRHSCLMGCKNGCNITVQGAGKLAYTLGDFEPNEDAAQGIVDYAALFEESETGQVPYRQWPQSIKGHFVTRHPPIPEE
ncbi:hypothetical protein AIOL_000717 [Candidatus Rhodobacter oscarellae]|uniref:Metal-binding protein n=1 Tax=Candidatus Rhodobacter oscarellae TaxID=1675527 RepID=A0A0J9ECU5_9RHOB|nr:DUF1636 domain-containing protein [Candidatus Rhodobacter lobularis]KMW60555.1 hypothetical protein AIOL_000717 [Candidatus Rhodobacter lobularis]